MGLVEKQWIFVQNVAKLIEKAKELNIVLTLGETYRTHNQQLLNYYGYDIDITNDRLCFIKRRKTSKTLNSYHQKRLAIDFNFFIDGKLTYDKNDIQPLGDYWESLHPKNRWGGNFKNFIDTPHFEMTL